MILPRVSRGTESSRDRLRFSSLGITVGWGLPILAVLGSGSTRALGPLSAGTLALSGLGFLASMTVVLALYSELTRWLRWLGIVLVAVGLIDATAILVSLASDRSPGSGFGRRDAEGLGETLMALSLVMLTSSACLILTRLLSNRASQARFRPTGSVQRLFLLFWRQHQLVGWMALALVSAHSVHFLLTPGGTLIEWSGIAATVILLALGLLGLFTTWNTFVRLWVHRALALGLGVALALHWQTFLISEAAVLLIFGAGVFINLKLLQLLAGLGSVPLSSRSQN